MIEIPKQGPAVKTERKDEIEALEQYLAPFDDALRMVFPDGKTSEFTLERRLEELVGTVRNLQKAQWLQTSPAVLTIEGHPPSVAQGIPADRKPEEGD
jgi:hypothetical protein